MLPRITAQRPHARRLRLLLLLTSSLLLGCVAQASEEPETADAGPRIHYQDGQLSLSVTEIDSIELLDQIALEANFSLVLIGQMQPAKRSWHFTKMPLRKALKSILRPFSSVLVLTSSPQSTEVISQVVVIGQSRHQLAEDPPQRVDSSDTLLANAVTPSSSQESDAVDHDVKDHYPDTAAASVRKLFVIDETEPSYSASDAEFRAHQLALDEDPDIRQQAVEYLAAMKHSQLMAIGLGDTDPEVRISVVEGLSQIESLDALILLGQVILSDTNPVVRKAAVDAVSQAPATEVTRAFLTQATKDKDPAVIDAAIKALSY